MPTLKFFRSATKAKHYAEENNGTYLSIMAANNGTIQQFAEGKIELLCVANTMIHGWNFPGMPDGLVIDYGDLTESERWHAHGRCRYPRF